ncbi:MAG TPA: suppressor of fused domain protein [Polyangiaceae bacterium]|jgi:hypothetical protein|nr:suppressor of fused domain protein [Polyangiaceae bacterium]
MTTSEDRLSRFQDHLTLVLEQEPEIFEFDSTLPGLPGVVCLVYREVPEPGMITGVTFGLSEVSRPEWLHARPELLIAVDSADIAWALAAAEAVNHLRGKRAFSYGEVIDFHQHVSEESAMSAFFVFAPAILERTSYAGIDVGGEQPIDIAGLYPIYDSERAIIGQLGLETFWNHPDFDLYDVQRRVVQLGNDGN